MSFHIVFISLFKRYVDDIAVVHEERCVLEHLQEIFKIPRIPKGISPFLSAACLANRSSIKMNWVRLLWSKLNQPAIKAFIIISIGFTPLP
ncbi:MAG: hypothetical protein JW786_13890, partial [Desulfobacterales bacterium]|nr:hypothetical protein [Desulfobacterales bacterium]